MFPYKLISIMNVQHILLLVIVLIFLIYFFFYFPFHFSILFFPFLGAIKLSFLCPFHGVIFINYL